MYKDVDKETLEVIKSFCQSGEITKAVWIKHNDKIYKSIQFRKKGFGKDYYILKGILFLTEENEIVKDEVLLEELEKLTYYYKIIFNEENKNSIVSTFENEDSIIRYEDDSNRSLKALDFLKDEGMDEVSKLKEIIIKVVELRKGKNNRVKELLTLNNTIKDSEFIFSDDVLNEAYKIFEDILRINFQSVKLVNSWRVHYEDLIKRIRKKKMSLAVKLNRDLNVSFIKLEYIVSYFKKVLNTYDSILDLDQNAYMKYIRSKHRENIKENLKGIRA